MTSRLVAFDIMLDGDGELDVCRLTGSGPVSAHVGRVGLLIKVSVAEVVSCATTFCAPVFRDFPRQVNALRVQVCQVVGCVVEVLRNECGIFGSVRGSPV